MTLFEQAASFLETEGWEVARLAKGPSSIVGSREEYGESTYFTVWCPKPEELERLRQWESTALQRFADDVASPGRKVLLLDSQAGLSNTFRGQVKANGVTVQAPIQFFDRTFGWDETATGGRRAASAAKG